jgi:peptidoglycan/LPS O-acetylase OafA/YrhL
LRPVYFPWINNEVYSVLFCSIIINLSSNDKSIFSLENSFFDYLGKISYGIYMYHPLCIVAAIYLLNTALKGMNLNHNVMIYFLSIAFTILLSTLSYSFFESPFLKLKSAFSKIISGDNAKAKDIGD